MSDEDRQRLYDDILYMLPHLTDKQLTERHRQIAAQVTRRLVPMPKDGAGGE